MLSLIELEPVPPEWKSLARTLQLAQVVALQVRQRLVRLRLVPEAVSLVRQQLVLVVVLLE
jgi:hypothetical protein